MSSTSNGSDSRRYPVHPSFRVPEHGHTSPRDGGALPESVTGAGGAGGGSGGTVPLSVTDGTTTVPNVTSVDVQSPLVVSDEGGGAAGIALTGPASGDLSGSYPGPTVVAIQGRAVSSNPPSDGQQLRWIAANNDWEPATPNNADQVLTDKGDLLTRGTPGTTDYAHLGTASADNSYFANPPSGAIDANDTTYWAPSDNGAHWLAVDLGSSLEIGTFRLLQSGGGSTTARAFYVESSFDNATWTVRYTGAATADQTESFPPVTARYWRARATAAGPNNWAINTFSLWGGAPLIRVPVSGTDGRVLTEDSSADGGISWQAPAGMSNPMTTQDDLIVGGMSGAPARLGKGTDGQVLIVDPSTHHLIWATPLPLTTKGDILGFDIAADRVSIGSDGYVLTADSTQALGLKWAANPSGFSDPTTTKGDLIAHGTATTRLPVGTDGQVLTADSTQTLGMKWGDAGTPTFHGCRAYNSAAQSVSNNTFAALTFDSEAYDTDAYHSTGSNTSRMTIPTGLAGYYLIIGLATFSPVNTTGRRLIALQLNGTSYITGSSAEGVPNSTSSNSIQTSVIVHLAEGDYVELIAYQTSGGNLDVGQATGPASNALTIQFLGA